MHYLCLPAIQWYMWLGWLGQRRRVVAVKSLSIEVSVNATHVATWTPSSPKLTKRLIQRYWHLVGLRQGFGHNDAGGLPFVKEPWLSFSMDDFKRVVASKNSTGTRLESTHFLH